jgi:hypothetical protein
VLLKNHRHVKSGDDEEQFHRYDDTDKNNRAGSPFISIHARWQMADRNGKSQQYSEIAHFRAASPRSLTLPAYSIS